MSNIITKTKIEWADYIYNPVWGCLNNCQYCYARKIAKRFYVNIAISNNWTLNQEKKECLKNFKPIFLESNFNKSFSKQPAIIFINSMSDIAYWKPEWMERVLNKIKEYQQHKFLFLTKNPLMFDDYSFPNNCWLGATITNQKSMNDYANGIFETTFDDKSKLFVSIEPIQENIKIYINFDWVIIGAESGNRKNKIIPNVEWIENIRESCRISKTPLFEKDNLKPYLGRPLIKQFPKELTF